eukprot:510736_1
MSTNHRSKRQTLTVPAPLITDNIDKMMTDMNVPMAILTRSNRNKRHRNEIEEDENIPKNKKQKVSNSKGKRQRIKQSFMLSKTFKYFGFGHKTDKICLLFNTFILKL